MSTYVYPNSKELFSRATKVIPGGVYGHLGPSNGCFIPVDAFPFFAERAEGAYFYDVDGNAFIDYMCAYGPNVLGYNHPEVDYAAKEQMEAGNCTTLPSKKMVELSEILVDTVESADWSFFAKNGGDVTSLAVMTARAATNRHKIVKFSGGYHGVAPWTQGLGYPGVLEEEVKNIITIPYNDAAAFERCIEQNLGQIAGLIATPYNHPAMADNALPIEGFWKKIRAICSKNDIVLIVDDVRCGFRLDTKGSDYHYGFKADLICFCKALANGYNISALCGIDALKSAVSSVFYTGSYWMSAVPMAAAIKTLSILKEIDGPAIMRKTGLDLSKGLERVAEEEGYKLIVTGEPSMFFMRLDNDETSMKHQRWISECVKRGVFFTNHHNLFMNTAMSEEDINNTLNIAREAFQAMEKGVE